MDLAAGSLLTRRRPSHLAPSRNLREASNVPLHGLRAARFRQKHLRRMSDLPAGEWMPDWDGLYWTFIDDHREVFARNQRSRMEVSLLDAMYPEKRREHRRRAEALLGAGHGATRLLRTATAIEGPHALS
jgi:hypothetical protein